MKNKNFIRKRQAIYISPNKKSTRIIKTLMDFFFFIKVKIKMVCFSVPSLWSGGFRASMKLCINIDADTGFKLNGDSVIPDGYLFDPASYQ